MSRTLVAEKSITGKFCGLYRVYDKQDPDKTLDCTDYLHLPQFLQECVYNPPLHSWDECEVIDPEHGHTHLVHFDNNFRKDVAKELLIKLYAINNDLTTWIAEDIIDYVQSKITDCESDNDAINAILSDYLGLSNDYAWIFKE